MKSQILTYLTLVIMVFAMVSAPGEASRFAHAAPAAPPPDGLNAADWVAIQSFLPSDYLKASNMGVG